MVGIRLDSGDLAYLSIEARRMLDEAGFPKAAIVACNDLDEHLIASLKQQGATIGVWGVGTRLVTAYDQPALGGVYKLSAIREPGGAWQDRVKLSEQAARSPTPASCRCGGSSHGGLAMADVIYDERHPSDGDCTIVDPLRPDPPQDDRRRHAERGPAGARSSGAASACTTRRRWPQSRERTQRQLAGVPRRASSGSSTRTNTRPAWKKACTSVNCR